MATIFEGDNGGATSTGVSATEIRVAVPSPAGFGIAGTNFKPTVAALIEHFNRRFEFYGRRLVPVFIEGSAADASLARALGATIASQQVFAATTGNLESEASNYGTAVQVGLLHELARQGIVTATRNAGTGWSDRSVFDVFHPYMWAVYPSAEANYDNLASFICTALVGRPASHAPDTGLRTITRHFGIVAVGQQTPPNVTRLVDGLRGCGEEPAVFQSGTGANANDLRAGMERLRAAGVTSIINVSEGRFGYEHALPTAKGMGYEPEWVVLPYALATNELIPQQTSYKANYIRLESGPRLLPLQATPWFGALLDGGSDIMQGSARTTGFYVSQSLYDGLLLLASGIQGAGPTLTPDTFAQGLMSTAFPNPGAGAPPYWQPSAGFGPGDHAFYDDFAVAWWSATAPSVEAFSAPQGSWCYLGAGARFRAGSYPADADSRLYSAAEPCR